MAWPPCQRRSSSRGTRRHSVIQPVTGIDDRNRQSAYLLARLDRPSRASQLELTAHRLGYRSVAARIASAAPGRPWQTRWSHGRRPTDHQVIPGHTDGVTAVAAGALPDGTPVIISGGHDGTVRVWRTADGTPLVLSWTYLNRYGPLPFTATASSLRPGPTSLSTSQRSRGPWPRCCSVSGNKGRPVKPPEAAWQGSGRARP